MRSPSTPEVAAAMGMERYRDRGALMDHDDGSVIDLPDWQDPTPRSQFGQTWLVYQGSPRSPAVPKGTVPGHQLAPSSLLMGSW